MDEANVSTQDKENIAEAVKVVRQYESIVSDILTGKQQDIGQLTTVMRGEAYDETGKVYLEAVTTGPQTYEGELSIAHLTSEVSPPIEGAPAVKITACVDASKLVVKYKETGQLVPKEELATLYTDEFIVKQTADGWFIVANRTDYGKTC